MATAAAFHDEAALTENLTEYITHLLKENLIARDPDGVERPILKDDPVFGWAFELSVLMFEAGAGWADATSDRESKSIITKLC